MISRHLLVSVLVLAFYAAVTIGEDRVDHSDIVRPEEMAVAKQWFDARIATMSDQKAFPRPIVRGLSQGWGHFQCGKSVSGHPIQLNGKSYSSGFGSHAPAVVEVLLPTGQARFSGVCGVDDTPSARSAGKQLIFTIEADGHEIFHSGSQRADMPPAAFDIDVHDVKRLVLKADTSDGYAYTPVNWADLKLVSASGASQFVGLPADFIEGRGICFSFVYDGSSSDQFLNNWAFHQEDLPVQSDRVSARLSWTDPATGLQCVTDITRYTRYPVVEWVQHFRNTGKNDTPLLTNVRAMDIKFPAAGKLLLHYNTGDYAAADSYSPHLAELKDETSLHFAPTGGRPTDTAWPYYNVENVKDHNGIILATAWPGQWSASFDRTTDFGGVLNFKAGQQLLHTRLHPGEEIRTPLSVVLFYQGDVTRSQNVWRRWMLDCNTPHPNGKLPPQVRASSLGLWQSEKSETEGIKSFADHGAKLTHWWMDAGWYPCKPDTWWDVGEWVPDPKRFPNGIKPISDLAHANNQQLVLWFEPERAHANSWLWKTHPEWLLTSSQNHAEKLLDLGNPEAWSWLVEHIDGQFNAQGVDIYRQDFNFEPLTYWTEHDAPDRRGMTEMRHVEGYLSYWDELHRRHPDMLFDTCASGGRRLDLETLRRSVPLWRCDDSTIAEDNQGQTYGIASWIPYYGTGVGCDTPYQIRSAMLPFLAFGMPTGKQPMDWKLYLRETANWEWIKDDLLGDFYPLLPYRSDNESWMAWQFDRPNAGRGTVQAFRRPDSPFSEATIPLHALDPAATYTVTNLDLPEQTQKLTGRYLTETGVKITMTSKPDSAIIKYEKDN